MKIRSMCSTTKRPQQNNNNILWPNAWLCLHWQDSTRQAISSAIPSFHKMGLVRIFFVPFAFENLRDHKGSAGFLVHSSIAIYPLNSPSG